MRKRKLSSEAQRLLAANPGGGDLLERPGEFGAVVMALLGDRTVVDDALLFRTSEDRMLLLTDVANGLIDSGAAKKFRTVWFQTIRPESDHDLFELRDQLRGVWKNPNLSDHILQTWLMWQPSDELAETYKRLNLTQPKIPPFRCSIKAGRFVPDFQSLRAMLIQGIFEHSKNFKVCSNPSCVTPYFIARRRDQKLCNNDICREEKQREYQLNWWNTTGKKKRRNGQLEKVPKRKNIHA